MTPEAVRNFLHDPDEIDVEEYRIIHNRLCELLRCESAGLPALAATIESCHRFIDWAEATRMVLIPIHEELSMNSTPQPNPS